MPEKLRADPSDKSFEIIALTRIKGFPVVSILCSKDDIAKCRIKRRCRIPNIDTMDSVGIGMSENLNILAIGDRKAKVVRFYRYRTCNNVVYSRSSKLPAPFKEMSYVDIDLQDNLWISTTRPDDFTKGSISMWPKSEW